MRKKLLEAEMENLLKNAEIEVKNTLDELDLCLKTTPDDVYGRKRRINCGVSYLQAALAMMLKYNGMSEIWKIADEPLEEEKDETEIEERGNTVENIIE